MGKFSLSQVFLFILRHNNYGINIWKIYVYSYFLNVLIQNSISMLKKIFQSQQSTITTLKAAI